MDFLRKLFGGGGNEGDAVARVGAAFAGLDKHRAGLSRDIAQYVVKDSGSSVLSTLSTQAVQTYWQNNGGHWRWNVDKNPIFKGGVTWSHAQQHRLGEIMSALHPLGSGGDWGMMGTATSPGWLRHVLSMQARHDGTISNMDDFHDLATGHGAGMEAILDLLFSNNPRNYNHPDCTGLFSGTKLWLAAHAAEVIAAAPKLGAAPRSLLVAAIGRFGQTGPYLDLLVDAAVASAKTVKEAAYKALTGADPKALAAALDQRFPVAAPGAAVELVNLVSRTLGAGNDSLLQGWRATTTAPKVLAAIDAAQMKQNLVAVATDVPAAVTGGYIALDGSLVELLPAPPPPEASEVPDAVMDLLKPSIQSFNQVLEKGRQEAKTERWHWSKQHRPITHDTIRQMKQRAQSGNFHHSDNPFEWMQIHVAIDRSGIDAFFASPHLTLRHVTIIARATTYGNLLAIYAPYGESPASVELRRRIHNGADLRTVQAMWAPRPERKISGNAIEAALASWGNPTDNVEGDHLWPLVAENLDLIEEALGFRPQSGPTQLNLSVALDLLAVLPKVPQRLLMPLMTIATGTRKGPRGEARKLLAGAPDIDGSILHLLGDSKQEVRAGAAEWLGQRGNKTAITPLRQAQKGEKSDIGKAAIISALERLGDDVSDLFDPALMKKEAEVGLAKAGGKGLEWLSLDNLPALKWRDGRAVDPVLVRWWAVLANKLKQPGGNALIDMWLDRLAPGDADRLGRYVLTAWIDQDTRSPTQEEANAYALSQVDSRLQSNLAMVKRYPQSAEYYITDRDRLFAQLKNEQLRIYLGSAADNKGLLALTTRVGGADAARAAKAYLKNHGARVSQCKALLEALAANPSGAAIQVVLATANRFKARSVQALAAELIDAIATRRGWTAEELADRTIPTAGLDETGAAEIDCGNDRTYRMVVDESDSLVLLNTSGQPVKALPTARIDDEKPLLDEAKKLLVNARKEIKQVVPDQTARLREAMCLERRWPADDWNLYILGHPLVARLARRLVWMGLDADGNCLATFRPLDDNSLTDTGDNTVDLSRFALVQLAHSLLVPADVAAAWRTHLADYEVTSPFDQFGRDLPKLAPEQLTARDITDRKGWMIETFKLRGAAIRQGYVRGAAEDGGVFMTYERRYVAAGLIALIHFSGSPLPEENLPAALFELNFARIKRNSNWHGATVVLGDVPPVLLAETWQDLYDIAAKGTGFDPQWEKKTPW
ncbi:DUF4132 domain-containing protein [Asticcacaulis sp. AC402]|uniref:DUF4132 domain-containing protein n=1 Tax=Asticcacaulis sp. AC402 TaxID=1282361 RepID=UPI0003C3DA27|nr:DUF4132 domain-containing protein [Asticcacaulis sp. AC402]ESQ75232.1 hypothetical protein ABAC402_10315 [Asticcacaulis sp. AC402]